ncbi:MAG: hypothetical protein LBM26_03305 [Methanobrevibacter sp.]|jgi:hypothetical protein|nr:hypothetical protein [Methanobrevibacter sp.]
MKVEAIEKIINDLDEYNSENDVSESKITIISKNGAKIIGLHTDFFPMEIEDDLLNIVGSDHIAIINVDIDEIFAIKSIDVKEIKE